MDIEVQIVNDECNGFNTISLNLDIDKTIGDIIKNLIENNNINNNDDNQHLLLYHIDSGIIFNENITINQCMKQINITTDDKLSFNLGKMFKSSNENTENKENKENKVNNTDDNNNNNNEQEIIITNLKSEIEQYRLQISNLELRV